MAAPIVIGSNLLLLGYRQTHGSDGRCAITGLRRDAVLSRQLFRQSNTLPKTFERVTVVPLGRAKVYD